MKLSTPWLVGGLLVLGIIYILVQSPAVTPTAAPAPEVATPDVVKEAPKPEAIKGSGTYAVDTSVSALQWTGRKTFLVDYLDKGSVPLQSGSVSLADGMIKEGTFTIDLSAIHTDSTGKNMGESMLEKHLKSGDFFDVATYPTATFTLTDVKATEKPMVYDVTGNLTVRGVTKPVSFSATIADEAGKLHAKGRVQLDRTLWGLKYGSSNFFKNLGDNVIDNLILIELDLYATLQP